MMLEDDLDFVTLSDQTKYSHDFMKSIHDSLVWECQLAVQMLPYRNYQQQGVVSLNLVENMLKILLEDAVDERTVADFRERIFYTLFPDWQKEVLFNQ